MRRAVPPRAAGIRIFKGVVMCVPSLGSVSHMLPVQFFEQIDSLQKEVGAFGIHLPSKRSKLSWHLQVSGSTQLPLMHGVLHTGIQVLFEFLV
jgi:hypothetical protein